MKLKSRKLQDFIDEILYVNRNPKDTRVLQLLDNDKNNPSKVIPIGTKFYRCRVIKTNDKLTSVAPFFGFDAESGWVPPKEFTRDMRANYRYIPYLYCSTHPYVAVCEMRPRIGARISVATIENREELRLFDLTCEFDTIKDETKRNLLLDLSSIFLKPVTEEDDIQEYIPTQYISEFIKNKGYDGILYKSSVTPEYHERIGAYNRLNADEELYEDFRNRNNAVIFNYKKCESVHSNIIKVTNSYIGYCKDDMDTDGFTFDPMNELVDAATFRW